MCRFYLPDGQALTPVELAALQGPVDLWFAPAVAFARYWLSAEGDDPGWRVQTSGSTGPPKATLLFKAGMRAAAEALQEALPPGATRYPALSALPLTSVGGMMSLARGMVWGSDVLLAPATAHPLAGWAVGMSGAHQTALPRPGLVSMVPYQVGLALADPAERAVLAGLGVLLIGGGPLSEPLVDELMILAREGPVRMYHTYALTEATGTVALRELRADQPGFRPLPGYRVRVDEGGALCVQGPTTGGAWLRTTDALEWVDEPGGAFRILGRLDEAINVAGSKYHPGAIEGRLSAFLPREMRRYQIVGVPDRDLGERLGLALEGEALDKALIASINTAVKGAIEEGALSRRERPTMLILIPDWPTTETGKTARRQVIDRAQTIVLGPSGSMTFMPLSDL